MNNQFDTKKFRVLFVEDEELAREKLGKFLKRKFDEVELCTNGLDGFLKFQEFFNEDKKFDLVLSDINMPKMDGLEMIERIKEIDSDIPCIFISARNETEQLIKAINLQIKDYILKPIDLEVISNKLDSVCEDLYYKKMYDIQKSEMKNYMEILDHEALISRTDKKGKITFVNDGFCEVSGYSREELISASHNIVRHPDVSKSFFEDLWKTIKEGKIWSGTHKNLAKDKTTYFVNTKIFPIYDIKKENIKEYMAVRFLVTEEEQEKRKSFRRFIEQVSDYKKTIAKLKEDKQNIEKKLNSMHRILSNLEEKVRVSEEKRKELLMQLENYEKSHLEYSKIEIMEKKDKSKQFDDMYKSLQALKTRNLKLENSNKTMQMMYDSKIQELDDFIEKDMKNQKRINDLKDLVTNLQKENKELAEEKKSILNF